MYVRASASALVCVLFVGLGARAEAQLLPRVTPVFERPATPTFNARRASLFEPGQIVDRPTSDLRPRFHWGVFGSFIPNWSILGSMGNLLFEDQNSPKMSGRDVRVGFVRGRQLGFELGVSFVRKTVTSLNIEYRDPTNSGQIPTLTYTAPNNVHMTGLDAHVIIPFARIGERVQLGILAGGGMAWLPETPIQLKVEGPPFYADAASMVPLTSPPATGGYVRQYQFSAPAYPLLPGTRYGITQAILYDISPTDVFWMLLRGQLAADILVAPPLKIRLAGGFHYPGIQAIGVDAVYLFRTGRGSGGPSDPVAAGGTPPAQVADRPPVIAPRRSYWGVLGGVTPKWWTPRTWSGLFEPDIPEKMEGQEFRVGLTRGRPLGYEFGVSFVMKTMTDFTFIRPGDGFPSFQGGLPSGFFETVQTSRITLSTLDTVRVPGADFHAFVPIGKLGSRVLLGGLMGAGIARMPDAAIRKRVDGPSYFASTTNLQPLATLPANGGFVVDDQGQMLFVAPGQTGTEAPADVRTISPLGSTLVLARGQLAADVLLAAPFKLRFSGGFNYPGAQAFGIEAIYLFGTGR